MTIEKTNTMSSSSPSSKIPSSPVAAAAAAAATSATTPESSSKENQPSGNATATPATSKPAAPGTVGAQPSAVEFEPPVACVRRILKNTLHKHTNVGKDSVTAFARAGGIFIIYLTACANDFARENRRQTITANDVLAAIKVRSVDVGTKFVGVVEYF